MQSGPPEQSKARPHARFATLDAIRGVAALVVVFRHLGSTEGTYVPPFSSLAVDIFFVLSGFVLAYANDRRFEAGQSAWKFMVGRFKRLAPLYSLGIALALVSLLVIPGHLSGRALAALGINALGLPSPIQVRGTDYLFPDNIPLWSIFFEFWIANLALAVFWSKLQGLSLYILIGACAVGLCLSERLFYTVDVGAIRPSFAGGFLRVGFSFFAGVALSRAHQRRASTLRVPGWSVLQRWWRFSSPRLRGRRLMPLSSQRSSSLFLPWST